MFNDFEDNHEISIFLKMYSREKFSSLPDDCQERLDIIYNSLIMVSNSEREYKIYGDEGWKSDIGNIIHNLRHINKAIENSDFSDITKNNSLNRFLSEIGLTLFRIVYRRFIAEKSASDTEMKLLCFFQSRNGLYSDEVTRSDIISAKIREKYISDFCQNETKYLHEEYMKVKTEYENHLEKIKSITSLVDNWTKTLSFHQENVKSMTANYNFARLADAFRNILENKRKELTKSKKSLILMGIFSIAPMIFSMVFGVFLLSNNNFIPSLPREKLPYVAPILASIEIVLIYYFRIILKEHLSLKAQILQLELRYGVCAFIEGYIDFAKDVDKNKLERFEALIFSNITPDPSSIPSTFDGMDQLVNLAKAASGK